MKTLILAFTLVSSVAWSGSFEEHDFNMRIKDAQNNQDELAQSISHLLNKEQEKDKEAEEVKRFLESEIEWYEDSHIVHARDIVKDRAPNSVEEPVQITNINF